MMEICIIWGFVLRKLFLIIIYDTIWNTKPKSNESSIPIEGGIAQTVWRFDRGWTVRGSNPGVGEILRTLQTGIGAQTFSCTMCTGSVLKLIISVGYHDIPVFIIKGSSIISVPVRKHKQSCRFLKPNLLLSTITWTVTTLVQCWALYQVSVVIPEHYERFQASAAVDIKSFLSVLSVSFHSTPLKLHIHLHRRVALTRRTDGRSLGNFQTQCYSGNNGRKIQTVTLTRSLVRGGAPRLTAAKVRSLTGLRHKTNWQTDIQS